MRSLVFVVLLLLSLAAHAAQRVPLLLHIGGGVGGTGPNFWVTLGSDGLLTVKKTGLPIVAPGKLSESRQKVHLSKAAAASIIHLAEATDDFQTGCEAVPDGISATLVLRLEKKTVKRECWSSSRWPTGAKTKRLLNQLNSNLAKEFQIE